MKRDIPPIYFQIIFGLCTHSQTAACPGKEAILKGDEIPFARFFQLCQFKFCYFS